MVNSFLGIWNLLTVYTKTQIYRKLVTSYFWKSTYTSIFFLAGNCKSEEININSYRLHILLLGVVNKMLNVLYFFRLLQNGCWNPNRQFHIIIYQLTSEWMICLRKFLSQLPFLGYKIILTKKIKSCQNYIFVILLVFCLAFSAFGLTPLPTHLKFPICLVLCFKCKNLTQALLQTIV